MPATASRLSHFTESVIRAMTRLSNQHGAINLSQGFPDFGSAGARARRAGEGHARPFSPIRRHLGSAALSPHSPPKSPAAPASPSILDQNLVVTCGSTEAMMCAMMTCCNPGDKVIIFSPFYENYGADAILSGAEPIYVPLRPPQFSFDPDELARAFASGAKAIIVCNPSPNPTGKVFTRAELQFILDLAEKHNAFVITDEPYEHIVYAPHEHVYVTSLPGVADRVIVCNSLSKTYSITGWRLGYVHAAPHIIAQARKVHDFLTVGAAAPLQEAAIAGLELPPSYYAGLQATYTPPSGMSSSRTSAAPACRSPSRREPTMCFSTSHPSASLPIPKPPSGSSARSAWLASLAAASSASPTPIRFHFAKKRRCMRQARSWRCWPIIRAGLEPHSNQPSRIPQAIGRHHGLMTGGDREVEVVLPLHGAQRGEAESTATVAVIGNLPAKLRMAVPILLAVIPAPNSSFRHTSGSLPGTVCASAQTLRTMSAS